MKYKIYHHILQGHEATEQNAYDHANGIDWQSEYYDLEESLPLHDYSYVDTVNGIDIYKHIGTGSYVFGENCNESAKKSKEKDAKHPIYWKFGHIIKEAIPVVDVIRFEGPEITASLPIDTARKQEQALLMLRIMFEEALKEGRPVIYGTKPK
jgi:hypothetical protein